MRRATDAAAERGDELPPSPVLVAGAGRSGTTWLGKLLDASPRVLYRHEPDNTKRLDWFRDVPSRIEPEDDDPRLREAYRRGLRRCMERHALQFVRDPRFPKRFLRDELVAPLELGLRAARRLGLGSLELPLPRLAWREDRASVHLVVKSVTSNLRLAWIRRQFPEMRLVLILRHPGGYLSSWLRGARHHGWKGFGDRARLDPTLLPMRAEHALWAERYEKGDAFERELVYWIVANEVPLRDLEDDEALLPVVYEELCESPQPVLRRILAHCGIPEDPAVWRFLDRSTARHDEGYHTVFRDPRRAATQWRRELSATQRERVERWLAESRLAALWGGPA